MSKDSLIGTMKKEGMSLEDCVDFFARKGDHTIFIGYRGSKAHGTSLTDSELGVDTVEEEKTHDDVDLMSVYIPPIEHYIGFGRAEGGQTQFRGNWDVVSYELRKFVRLLLASNPNILTMLWLNSKHILHSSPSFQNLMMNRDLFINKNRVHSAFVGYALSQSKRMVHWESETRRLGAKRKALIEKFGYDTKNASHLIRLLCLGIEFLKTGEFFVDRSNPSLDRGKTDELISIKKGEWALNKVQEYAAELFEEAEQAYAKSSLPAEPSVSLVEELLVDIITEFHSF